jgi:hypothetical protein
MTAARAVRKTNSAGRRFLFGERRPDRTGLGDVKEAGPRLPGPLQSGHGFSRSRAANEPGQAAPSWHTETDRRSTMGYNRSGKRRTQRLKRAKRLLARLAARTPAGSSEVKTPAEQAQAEGR